MSLSGTLDRIEKILGSDGEPRRVNIWVGVGYSESWVERQGRHLVFHVAIPAEALDVPPMGGIEGKAWISAQPWQRFDVMAYLTDQMRRLLRPGDEPVVWHLPFNGRDSHSQYNVPPWKRKPFRLLEGGGYELQEADGSWTRFEAPRPAPVTRPPAPPIAAPPVPVEPVETDVDEELLNFLRRGK